MNGMRVQSERVDVLQDRLDVRLHRAAKAGRRQAAIGHVADKIKFAVKCAVRPGAAKNSTHAPPPRS